MSVGQTTYDHEIYNGTSTKGFNLIRDDQGKAMYQVIEDAPKYDAQIKVSMDGWSGGHGQFSFGDKDVYFSGQSIDTTVPNKIMRGPLINSVGTTATATLGANPVCFCWFSAISKLMVATATKVFWYDGTYFAEKWDATAIGTISDMKEYNGILYVALGSTAAYYTSADGAAYTVTDLTDHHADKFFVSPNTAGTSNVLWKSIAPNQLASTTNGQAGGTAWTTAAYIGDTSNNITNIFMVNSNLMVGKTDNLFHYDTDGGLHPLMDSLKQNRSTDNFKYVTDWQTASYFSLVSGLGEVTAYNTYEPIGPLTNIGNIGKVGTCIGLASDKDFLYIAMDEGTNNIIYKGRESRRGEKLRWEWCPWVFLSTNACATMAVAQHTSTDRRLWFGYGNNCGYVTITDDPSSDTNARFSDTSWIRFSYFYGTNPYWDKLFQSVVTETSGCTASNTVTPYYWKNTDTSSTALTAAITGNGVSKTSLTTALTCNRITFELDFNAREPTTTYTTDSGTGATTIVDSQLTSTADDYYNGAYVYNTTRGLSGLISDYVGLTKTITCASISGQTTGDSYYIAFSAASPIVTFFEARGVEKPETVRVHECVYSIGDTPTRKAETIRAFLRTARTTTTLLKFADLRYGDKTSGTAGTDYVYCVMQPGFPQEIEVLHTKGKAPELGIKCRFQEVNFS